MKHFNIFNCQGVSESRKVAWGPKASPPPSPWRKRVNNEKWGILERFNCFYNPDERLPESQPPRLSLYKCPPIQDNTL